MKLLEASGFTAVLCPIILVILGIQPVAFFTPARELCKSLEYLELHF